MFVTMTILIAFCAFLNNNEYINACYVDVRLYLLNHMPLGCVIYCGQVGALLAHLISESCLIVIWNSICTVYNWFYMYW